MPTINGTPGDDTLEGTAGDDVINGLAGNDALTGGEGSDILNGGDGNDTLQDETGADTLDGGSGDDVIFSFHSGLSNPGTVTILGGLGNDWIQKFGNTVQDFSFAAGDGDDNIELGLYSFGSILLSLGAGQDNLILGSNWLDNLDAPHSILVTDFAAGPAGDTVKFLDMLDIGLANWDGSTNPFATGHVRLLQQGANVALQIDKDGGTNSFVTLLIFQNANSAAFTASNFESYAPDGSAPSGGTFDGTTGNDNYVGGIGADTINGFAGDDMLSGSRGNDVINGNDGADELSGGNGDDLLDGGAGADILFGNNGIDTVNGDDGDDIIIMDSGDIIDGGNGQDTVRFSFDGSEPVPVRIDLTNNWIGGVGTFGNGTIKSIEIIDGGFLLGGLYPTDDSIIIGNGYLRNINIWGGAGSDVIVGGGGNDELLGGDEYSPSLPDSADIIRGGNGNDTIRGLAGDDMLYGDDGDDVIFGGTGDDTIFGGDGNDALIGDEGNDVLRGGAGGDVLYASFYNGSAYGDDGDDILFFGRSGFGIALGSITWDGGAGNDQIALDFSGIDSGGVGFTVDLTNTWTGGTGTIEGISVLNFETIYAGVVRGSSYLENLITIGANYQLDVSINGGRGNDTLTGGSGNDTIFGGQGNDILSGGNGNDSFQVERGSTFNQGIDTVDGGAGIDTIYSSQSGIFTLTRLANGDSRVSTPYMISALHNVERLVIINYTVNIQGFAPSDIDNDHNSDIVFFSQSSGLVSATAVVGGTLIENVTVASPASGAWDAQAVADLNADGLAEVILKNAVTGAFQISRSSGPATDLGVIGANWDVVGTGDFNADFTSDILWRDASNGHLYVWTFNYSAQQSGGADLGVLGTAWKAAGVGDFDNDGDADVLISNDVTGQVYLYRMQNGALSGGASIGVYGSNWIVDGVGDFNNDSIADIALKNTTTGQFYLLLMDSAGSYTGSSLGSIGTDWSIAATGDYTGDGTDDLLWRNTDTNQLYMWAMQDGHQAATGSAPYGYLAADQIIV